MEPVGEQICVFVVMICLWYQPERQHRYGNASVSEPSDSEMSDSSIGLNLNDGSRTEGKHQWLKAHGETHEGGTKFRIVLFRSDKNPKSHVMNGAMLRQKAREGYKATTEAFDLGIQHLIHESCFKCRESFAAFQVQPDVPPEPFETSGHKQRMSDAATALISS